MNTKLIQLKDGTLVEIKVRKDEAQQISGKFAEKVSGTFDKIHPILVKICHSYNNAWKDINQEVQIEQAEIEIGLSFEGEGNLYITKSTVGANIIIKLTLKSRKD